MKRVLAWEELNRLESLGCLQKVDGPSYLELHLSVVYSNKWRLVVDASRHLNPFLRKRTIKLEDLSAMADLVQQDDFLSTDDLDSGYWHMPLHPDMYPYVGCHMEDPATGWIQYFQWRMLFLGISDMVYIFTKLLRPVVAHLRRISWKGVIYIDDLGNVNLLVVLF